MASISLFDSEPLAIVASVTSMLASASGLCVPIVAYALGTLPDVFLIVPNSSAAAPVASAGWIIARRDMAELLGHEGGWRQVPCGRGERIRPGCEFPKAVGAALAWRGCSRPSVRRPWRLSGGRYTLCRHARASMARHPSFSLPPCLPINISRCWCRLVRCCSAWH
ncbi:hypothetical protein D3C80_1599730 [compost metagenome]